MESPELTASFADDDPDGVDARLRECARLSAQAGESAPLVDMSPAGVTARLDELAEISALAWELMIAGESEPTD